MGRGFVIVVILPAQPAAGVRDAVASCVKRKVGSAMVFAAGFAETGEQELQDEIARTARDGRPFDVKGKPAPSGVNKTSARPAI